MLQKAILFSVLIFLILLIISGVILNNLFSLDDLEQIKTFMEQSGSLGPFLIILLQALQVILVPIPGQITGLISGFFYGPFLGTFYSMVGLAIGSFIAFYLSRKLGRPFVEKIVPAETLQRFNHISENSKVSVIFLVFLLPMLPDDAICFLCGLTRIKISTLMVVAILGRLPGTFIANFIGNGVALTNLQTGYIFLATTLAFLVFLFKYRPRIEKKFNTYLKKYEGKK